ncbi:MAG: D-Ala-D-Ala carboxypeptidase family metallohydrolase [Micromonosporaceae bacterium]
MRTNKLTLLVAVLLAIATTFTVNFATAGPANADACYTWTRTLRQGASGSDVTQLQKRIAGWVAYGENLALDGAFGPATTSALKRFQSGYGLVADGIAGSATYSKIYALQDDDCTPIHFSHYEMNNNCGKHTYTGGPLSASATAENALRVMWQLEAMRRKLGDRPMVVTSGFRDYACNRAAGGSSTSNHLYGRAADLGTASGPTLCEMWRTGRYAGFEEILGPGYPNHNDHTHLANSGSQYWRAPNC